MPIPSGFKTREEWNAYMRDYSRKQREYARAYRQICEEENKCIEEKLAKGWSYEEAETFCAKDREQIFTSDSCSLQSATQQIEHSRKLIEQFKADAKGLKHVDKQKVIQLLQTAEKTQKTIKKNAADQIKRVSRIIEDLKKKYPDEWAKVKKVRPDLFWTRKKVLDENTPLGSCIKKRMQNTDDTEEEARNWCETELAGEHEPT